MLFTSMEFLLFFFPIVFGVSFLLPLKARNYWILLSSLVFYAWGEPSFVLIMLFSILFNYMLALRIEEFAENKIAKKLMLVIDLAFNLGILVVYKYMNFITATLHSWIPATRNAFPATAIALPIGISFFTFQALSYVIDVYRGVSAQKNIGYLGLYISLFPQLIAGPIVRYTTVMNQITERKVSFDSFSNGLVRFFVGFNKKILLANTLSSVADAAFSMAGNSVCMAWLGALCYTLQIFFDFSGYSDMALGLGRMLGFNFLENFDYPYISQTVTEFWRRWHISLGTWFRDYVYFPLGGSRVKTKSRLVFNLFVVWCLTGIWHGANWTFIFWGLMYGVIITVEKLAGIQQRLKKSRLSFRICYRILTLLLVMLGWVLFRADTLEAAMVYLKTMFGFGGAPFCNEEFLFNMREYVAFIIVGIVCATPITKRIREVICARHQVSGSIIDSCHFLFQFALFVISFSFLVMNAHNPFIYFNF